MQTHDSIAGGTHTGPARLAGAVGAAAAGVSWGAVIAGAVGAAALSVILVLLGLAFGFAVVSPWANAGAGADAIGAGTIAWLALTHVVAAGLGGYLAGRLRFRWADVHADEIYFRDTAHGFLAWSVATLVTAAMVGMALGEIADDDRAREGAAAMAMNATPTLLEPWTLEYYADSMFRADGEVEPPAPETRAQAVRVLEYSLMFEQLADEDREHLAQLVARHTGVAPAQAQQRVVSVHDRAMATRNQVQASLDELRSAAAWTSGWAFVALLMGAFAASLAATFGGRHRDSGSEDRSREP